MISTWTKESNIINGLFEIHITVDDSDMHKFRHYCLDKKLKPIMAVSETKSATKSQLMFSKYKNGTTEEVLDKAFSMAADMNKEGISITRIKVESMGSNEGVPKVRSEENKKHSEYFEYHIKIPIDKSEEYMNLKTLIETYSNTIKLLEPNVESVEPAERPIEYCAHNGIKIFLSFNAFKKTIDQLITIRIPGYLGATEAIKIKDDFMSYAKSNGVHTNEGIQFEYCVYDSNLLLD